MNEHTIILITISVEPEWHGILSHQTFQYRSNMTDGATHRPQNKQMRSVPLSAEERLFHKSEFALKWVGKRK